MRAFFLRFKKFFVNAALFSIFINLALLAPSLYMLQVFDRVLTSRSKETLIMLTLVAVIALLMMLALDFLRTLLLAKAGTALDRMLGEKVLSALVERGSQINRSDEIHGLRDVAILRGFLGGNSIIALFDLPWMLFYIGLIFLFHPLLGAVAILGGAILFVIAWSNEYFNRASIEKSQLAARKASHYIDQGVANVDAINAMGMTPGFVGKWKRMNEEVLAGTLATTERMGGISSVSRFVRQTIQIAMMGTGAYLVIDQHVSAGIMIATTIILGRALAPIESLIANWNNFVQARLAFGRLSHLFGPEGTRELTKLPPPQGRLTVENVVLASKSIDRPIIRQVSFELQAGDALGVIGPSASGKSSLARLIIGIWQPSAGAVRLDGADIGRTERAEIGPFIGYLPQDVELFPGTVAENIARMGEANPEAVVKAAMSARVHELILRLPNGYDTAIGPGGHILSGGQMQRIGLARALFGNPKLLVLDEPNSNLDAEGEANLLLTLQELHQAKVTVVLVTHKPAVLKQMDKLLVMREGRMELFGPCEEVLLKLREAMAQNHEQPAKG
jgi:PrtD family type I secretion system ABC transporter